MKLILHTYIWLHPIHSANAGRLPYFFGEKVARTSRLPYFFRSQKKRPGGLGPDFPCRLRARPLGVAGGWP